MFGEGGERGVYYGQCFSHMWTPEFCVRLFEQAIAISMTIFNPLSYITKPPLPDYD